MTTIARIAYIGNALPRRCGIATFTHDLEKAISKAGRFQSTIVAMSDRPEGYDYPPEIGFEIYDQVIDDYTAAAKFINDGKYDIVSLQHEFGIFGGDSGRYILGLISRLNAPVVTTLHTVLATPNASQRSVITKILSLSHRVVVMAQKAKHLLQSVYNVPSSKIVVIAHGIPDTNYTDPESVKVKRGFSGKQTILTFGLLSPNKGIEVVIDAMPTILKKNPEAVYIVVGATHPNLVRHQGEAYRDSLVARAKDLGVSEHVVFLNQFVDKETLLDFIAMSDIYVTPYLSEAQMTSGTLAYSFGMGKAIVSTPYWYAKELLADGRGTLVPFNDVLATGAAISDLLCDETKRIAIGKRAYDAGRSMIWPRVAEAYIRVFEQAARRYKLIPIESLPKKWSEALPHIKTAHLLAMCDSTGITQHSLFCVPDRSHGYCVDDNARALILACELSKTPSALPATMMSDFCAFIQHAWNRDTRRFRNFMSYSRLWLEDVGSEDSHGRALWALGVCARDAPTESLRLWAKALFGEALHGVEGFTSPRAWAFCLIGLDAYPCDTVMAKCLTERLVSLYRRLETHDHHWFEADLTYDNARLSQAVLCGAAIVQNPDFTEVGLKSLHWLLSKQCAPSGYFRPIGTDGYLTQGQTTALFDQQPLESQATIAACRTAWGLTHDAHWLNGAQAAFNWYFGDNDLGLSLIDNETGRCCDGLHPDRVNENCGAESVLAYLLSLNDMLILDKQTNLSLRQDPRDISLPADKATALTAA